jgi:hypothetical protein
MNVLSQEGFLHGVLCNALLPTAQSRMGEQMSAAQMKDFGDVFALAGPHLGNSSAVQFVTPLVVFLVSEACQSTHGIYSASLGRYARVFIGACDGWIGPRNEPPSAEDIAANFAAVSDQSAFSIPGSLREEFVEIINRLKTQ